MTPKKIIFACVHSAGRSQMAAGFFNALANPERASAVAAGTQPAERLHPEAVTVMKEAGVDLSKARPQKLTDDLAREAQLLITMGCGESCPFVPGVERDDWQLPDPKGQPLERVREIREEIRTRVNRLLTERGWAKTA